MNAYPQHDTAAAIDFLRRWSPDEGWCLVAIVPDGKTETRTFQPSQAEDAATWIESHQGKRNLYFTPNRVRRSMSVKPSKPDIAAFRAFWADLDPRIGEDLTEERQRIETLLTTGLPKGIPEPTAVCFSGGGYQALWLLAEPLAVPVPTDDNPEPWALGESYNRALEQLFSSDAVHNCDRVLRLPGTINVPNKKKAAKGRMPTLARLIEWSGIAYPLEAFKPAASTGASLATATASARVSLGDGTAVAAQVGTEELRQWAAANGKTIEDETLALIATGDASKWGGDRSQMVFRVVCDLVRAGVPDPLLGGLLLDPSNEAFHAHFKAQKTNRVKYAERQIERARTAVAQDNRTAGNAEDGSTLMWDRVNKAGEPVPSYVNTRTALQLMGIRCRYDKFQDRHLIEGHELQELAGDFSDHAERALRDQIIRRFGFDPGMMSTNSAVLSLCTENRFDSLVDHLCSLPGWDGTPRLDGWLVDYLGAQDNAYTREAGAAWLTAAVVRAFEPGAKFDQMLVLEGATGLRKSTALRVIATGTLDLRCNDRFSDAPFLGARDAREIMEVTAGVWILECAELDGLSKRDAGTLKAMITRQEDKGRAAYARTAVTVPRRFVLAGTTNESRYLRDPTGNRRYWPVQVSSVNIDGLHAVRNQLLAEALTRYRSGRYTPVLSPEAATLAKAEQDRRMVVDEGYMESLTDLRDIAQRGSGQWAGSWIVTNEAVYNRLCLPPDKRNGAVTRQVIESLCALGWKKVDKTVKVNGKACRIFVWDGEELDTPF